MVLRSQSVGEQDVADQQGAFSRPGAAGPERRPRSSSCCLRSFTSFLAAELPIAHSYINI